MPIGKYKKADKVAWISSSNGSTTRKVGCVEGVVPPGVDPSRVCPEFKSGGRPRDDQSYLVRVGKTERAKGTLYWPRESKLVKVV